MSENVCTIPRQAQKDTRSRDMNSPPLSVCSLRTPLLYFRITCTRTRSNNCASRDAACAFLRTGIICWKRVYASKATRMYLAPQIPKGRMGLPRQQNNIRLALSQLSSSSGCMRHVHPDACSQLNIPCNVWHDQQHG